MAQEFLIASGIVALQARGFNAIFAGMDRMRGAMGGVDAAHERMRDIQAAAVQGMADRQQAVADRIRSVQDAAAAADQERMAGVAKRVSDLQASAGEANVRQQARFQQQIAGVHAQAAAASQSAAQADQDRAARVAQRISELQARMGGASVKQQAAIQQQMADVQARAGLASQAAAQADHDRAARFAQRIADLQARMGAAGVQNQARLQQQITDLTAHGAAEHAAAAGRLAGRVQEIHQGAAVAEQTAAKQVAAGMTEATEAAAAAEAALPIAGFLGLVTVIAAVAAALYKLGEAFLQVRDAEVELGIALKIEGQDAAGASEKLEAHARSLAEFANTSRRSILDMEAQTLRLGISAEQAGRAVDIAVGVAKAKHTSIEEALHAVDSAIMGREEQLRRMLGEKRGGALTGDALLARATEVGQQGLEFRHTAALTTYEGAVELLSRRWEELRQTIGEAFGPAIMFYIKGFTASFEFLTGMIKDMAEGFRILGDWISETFVQPLDDIFGLSDAFQGMMDLFMNGWDGFKIQMEYVWTYLVNYMAAALLEMEDSFNSFLQAASFGALGWEGDNTEAIATLSKETSAAYEAMQDKLARRHSTEEWDTGAPLRQERSLATASTFDAVSLAKKIQESAFATADPHLAEQKKTNDWLEVIANGVTTGGWGPQAGGAVVGNW